MARKNAAQKQAQREKLEQLARENPEQQQQEEQEPKSKKQMHRKDKPWDVEGTDHWKVEPWNETDMSGPLLEESSFATVSRGQEDSIQVKKELLMGGGRAAVCQVPRDVPPRDLGSCHCRSREACEATAPLLAREGNKGQDD